MAQPPETILIVDDSDLSRHALDEILTARGYQLRFATGGAEALAAASAAPPDLILLDVMMPGMSGFEVCARMRADARLAEVPIILLTALDDRASRLRGLDSGADDFVSKPFDRAELLARIRTTIRLNRYRSLLAERGALEDLTALSPDAILVLDREGQIRFANGAAAALLGAPASADLLGADLGAFLAAGQVQLGHVLRLEAGSQLQVALRPPGSEAAPVPASLRARPVSWEGVTAQMVILRDESERQQMLAELQAGSQRLQQLTRRLVEIQEVERRALASELHDDIGQALTGLKLVLETGLPLDEEGLRANAREALAIARDLVGRVREIALGLRPSILDDVGLFPALAWLSESFQRHSGIAVRQRFDGMRADRFAPEVEIAAFRITQEALTNIARYAGVREAEVELRAEPTILRLAVRDEGVGFDIAALSSLEHPSSGLTGMRERATAAGGTLTIATHPGQGTAVLAAFPLRRSDRSR